ncbi:MAG: hypothetical protein M0001_05735 [Treponema sp.]|nr:hypothetical protein [Treponema sp.]
MKCVFGIDGGGTSSRLRVESVEGVEMYYAEGGSTNPNSNDRTAVEATFADLFSRAQTEAGIGIGDFVAGFAGSAGVDRKDDVVSFAAIIRKATGYAGPLGIGNDAEPALAGALDDTEGLLLIAGTGSIAFGRARDGSTVRAGGLGHLLGDEGSAWRIAFDAICRSLRSAEGRDLHTELLGAAIQHFGLASSDAFIPFVYGSLDKKRIARFARVVGEYRNRGDLLAIDLFDKAAGELALLAASVHDRIAARLEKKRLAFRGGLIESDESLRRDTESRIRARISGIEIVPSVADAARGACILARALAT